ncbi:aminodeoxychorismate lyase [Bacillus sp. V3B]|uniref:aminodeoxychorismate lyase n=1 Tax=Bacillus sp. V3B TaxID=2804915 RepID=UPI00210A2FC9|nr:aminodeoxychorismate lyase [Bacillus sp. V3B]MCQ6273692.1 aminodeoxychorismate lyase [Bacillus sp. V3B]
MNKRNVRSFAIGVFLSIFLIGLFYFFQNDTKQDEDDLEEARAFLEENGYIILEDSEYSTLQEKATIPKDIPTQEQVEEKVEEPNKSNQEDDVDDDQSAHMIINYQLEIVSGMTSNEIAKILTQNHIVQDETSFANFLINHGYHTDIQLGSFPLTNQMSFEQIANMITKR